MVPFFFLRETGRSDMAQAEMVFVKFEKNIWNLTRMEDVFQVEGDCW